MHFSLRNPGSAGAQAAARTERMTFLRECLFDCRPHPDSRLAMNVFSPIPAGGSEYAEWDVDQLRRNRVEAISAALCGLQYGASARTARPISAILHLNSLTSEDLDL